MKRAFSLLCGAVLTVLVLMLPVLLQDLPYEGENTPPRFAGVVRLGVWEGFSEAGGWLRDVISDYEKAHRGVYVMLKWCKEEDIRAVAEMDALLFPTGMIDAPEAVPVAHSGYVWSGYADKSVVALPPDTPDRSYSAAFLCACAAEENYRPAAVTRTITEGTASFLTRREAEGAQAVTPGLRFTDQTAWFLTLPGENEGRRQAASVFGDFLRKREDVSRWTGWEPLSAWKDGVIAPVYGNGWRDAAEKLLSAYLRGDMEAAEAVSELKKGLQDG